MAFVMIDLDGRLRRWVDGAFEIGELEKALIDMGIER